MSGDCAWRLDGRGPPFLADLSPLLHPWTTTLTAATTVTGFTAGTTAATGTREDDDEREFSGWRDASSLTRELSLPSSRTAATTAFGGGGATVAGCPSRGELSPSPTLFSSLQISLFSLPFHPILSSLSPFIPLSLNVFFLFFL
ncbi:hypothetical protein S83_016324 [Arachis hypogaea]|nr:uncharacterized protein DS421_5g154400 [Arachis hypogaea]